MATSRAEPDSAALRLWRRALDVRLVTLTVVALLSPWMPTLRRDGWLGPLLLLGVVVPYSALVSHRLRRTGRIDAWLPITDIGLAVLFATLIHEAWAAVVAVCVADVAFAVVVFGRRTAVVASAVGAVGLALAGRHVDHGADVGLLGFVTACVIVITTVGMVTSRERELRWRYSELVNGLDAIVWEFDLRARRMTFLSPQAASVLGWEPDEALDPATWRDRMHPSDAARTPLGDRLGDSPAVERTIEFRVRHADGRWIWLQDSMVVLRDETGTATSLRGIAVDVTAQRESAVALEQFRDIVERIELGVLVWRLTDPEDHRSLVTLLRNPASDRIFVNAAHTGRRLVDLLPGDQGEAFAQAIARTVRTGQDQHFPTVAHRPGGGEKRYFSIRIFPLPDNCAGLMAEDVTDERLAERQLRHRALHDTLTSLPNRSLLQERLTTALAAARRSGSPVALLVMDLDQFKEINDTLGHATGDRLLEQVGNRLAELLRDCDTVARLGGDEFAVLLTTDADARGAERVAQRIVSALAEPFELDGVRVQAGISIGIAVSPQHGADADVLTQRADVAMYAAKGSGRGYATYVADEDHFSVRRLALVGDLREAVTQDQLVLHYQPQVDIRSGAVVGVEALLRWQHPVFGLLPPSEFVALAEVSGAIGPLTRWVVHEALGEAASLAAAGHDLVMSVNVSGRNLYQAELVDDIREQLAARMVAPDRLMLELTESQLVDDPSQVMNVLTLVSEMGVRLSIDDFGTGWSSLANLTRLPIHQIKIDRSFVSRMLLGGDDAVVVRSILDLGHNLGLTVVAEGVEDEATLRALTDLGCDQAQGYHLARPVPAPDLRAWLDDRRTAAVG